MVSLAIEPPPPSQVIVYTLWQWSRVGRIWRKGEKYKRTYLVHFSRLKICSCTPVIDSFLSRKKNWFYSRRDGEIAIGISGVVEGF